MAEGRVAFQPPETSIKASLPVHTSSVFERLKCSSSAVEPRLKLIRWFFTVQSVTRICLPLAEAELMRRRRVRVSFALPHRPGRCSLAGIHLSSSALGSGDGAAHARPPMCPATSIQQCLVPSYKCRGGVLGPGNSWRRPSVSAACVPAVSVHLLWSKKKLLPLIRATFSSNFLRFCCAETPACALCAPPPSPGIYRF